MAALAQIDVMQDGVLAGLPMPLTFKPAVAMSDEDLIAFAERNAFYEIERNSAGELEIRMLLGVQGSHCKMLVGTQLFQWAERNGGIVSGPDSGFNLADGSMRKPDAAPGPPTSSGRV